MSSKLVNPRDLVGNAEEINTAADISIKKKHVSWKASLCANRETHISIHTYTAVCTSVT